MQDQGAESPKKKEDWPAGDDSITVPNSTALIKTK